MRIVVFCFALLLNTVLFAQSKKELEAQVSSLKAEITKLRGEKVVILSDVHKKASYGLGVLVATNLKSQGVDSLDVDAINAGIKDFFQNKPLKMDQQECLAVVQPYMQQAMSKKTEKVKLEGEAFLETNKRKEGVVTTASGLQYKVLTAGTGKVPTANDNVTVHYTGKLIDGTEFDSSVKRNEPASFVVSGVIPGWTEALQLMHEGDKWELYIPYNLAYGEQGAGGQIPPFSALIFELELIKVN